MKRVRATDVKVDIDNTGGLISFDRRVPLIVNITNYAFTYSGNVEAVRRDFETDQEWRMKIGGKSATVECCDSDSLF